MSSADASSVVVSLVTGSMLREDELSRLLRSLAQQRHRSFELIVVEQRDPSGARRLAASFPDVPVRVIESERGLSRARNAGMELAVGGVVAFPDDDCWYLPGTLARVAQRFAEDPRLDVLTGRVLTPDGDMIRYPRHAARITRHNVWNVAVSPGLFVSRRIATALGGFDDRVGVGADTAMGSGEESDYVLRALELGALGAYDPLLHVSHPSPSDVPRRTSAATGYSYGFGMGAMLRRHRYGPLHAARAVARPTVGALLAQAQGRDDLARFRRAVARGRRDGYRARGVES